jgi:hypothetical protein
VTDAMCQKAWSIQVKARASKVYDQWIVGKAVKVSASPSLVYIFVGFEKDQPVYLVFTSRIVAMYVRPVGGIQVFHPSEVIEPKRGWGIFGPASRMVLPLKKKITLPDELTEYDEPLYSA